MQELAHQIVSEHSSYILIIIWGLLYINILYLFIQVFYFSQWWWLSKLESKNVKYFDKSNFKVFSQTKNHMFWSFKLSNYIES